MALCNTQKNAFRAAVSRGLAHLFLLQCGGGHRGRGGARMRGASNLRKYAYSLHIRGETHCCLSKDNKDV
jgi:hypothetical protein